jgi:hypothetical protein
MNQLVKALVVAFAMAPVAGAAQGPAWVAPLPKGGIVASHGEQYRIVGGARAHLRAPHQSEAQIAAQAHAAPTDVVDRLGNFVVVREAGSATSVPATASPAAGHLVAVNERTGAVAVIPGTLTVRLRKGRDPAALARRHGVALVSAAPRIRAAFVRVPPGADLTAAQAALAKDPAVESVEIEVLERFAVPH